MTEAVWGLQQTAPALPTPEPGPERPFWPTEERPRRERPRRRIVRRLSGAPGVALVAALAGALAAAFASHYDLLLLYADARSHLTIARRLIDGRNPSIVQLGTVWLPLPHILLTPLVASSWLWHTGYAAIPLDIGCLVIEALAIFSIVVTLTGSRRAAWVGVVLLVTNPSILYLHTTALTEPVLYAAMLGTTAMLAKWAKAEKPHSGGEMALFCGLPAAAMILSRYDGWAFVAAAAGVVFLVARSRWHSWRYTLRVTRCFVTLPLIAAAWWLWFNWVNFGDPLEFQRGKYSAQAQQAVLAHHGLLPDQGQLVRSLSTFSSSIVDGAGWLLVAAAGLGMVLWLVSGRSRRAGLVPWLLLGVPFAFYALSLFTGQIAMRLTNGHGQSMFNLRYGVELVPGLCVFAALGVALLLRGAPRQSAIPIMVVACALVVVQGAAWWPNWRSVPVVAEGLQQRADGKGQYAAGEWLHDHAPHGTILIDDSVNPLLPVIDADLDRVIAPFSGPIWDKTLRSPSRADWLYVDTENPDDSVAQALRREPSVLHDFVLRFESGKARVYERKAT